MKLWQKIVAGATGFTVLVAAINIVVGWASEIQYDKEAQIWRSDHVLTEAQKFKADRIDRVQRENDRLEYDLLDNTLSVEQRQFKTRQIEKNDKKIECIREGTC